MPSAKNKRKPRCGSGSAAVERTKELKKQRLVRYVNFLVNKYNKLIARRERRLKRKNCLMKVRDANGEIVQNNLGEAITKDHTRFQGMKIDSERARRLQSHIAKLKDKISG